MVLMTWPHYNNNSIVMVAHCWSMEGALAQFINQEASSCRAAFLAANVARIFAFCSSLIGIPLFQAGLPSLTSDILAIISGLIVLPLFQGIPPFLPLLIL